MTQVQTTIAIVGCGGLGVPAAWTLALAGALLISFGQRA